MKIQFKGYLKSVAHFDTNRPDVTTLDIAIATAEPVDIPPTLEEVTFTIETTPITCTCITHTGDPQCPVHGRRAP